MPICFSLLRQLMRRACILARVRAGRSSAPRIAIMAITTNNSMSVKPARPRQARFAPFECTNIKRRLYDASVAPLVTQPAKGCKLLVRKLSLRSGAEPRPTELNKDGNAEAWGRSGDEAPKAFGALRPRPRASGQDALGLENLAGVRGGGNAVDLGPIGLEALDQIDCFLEPYRLDEVGVGAQLVGTVHIGLEIGGGEHDDEQSFEIGLSAGPLQHVEPVGAGHLEVEQDQKREGKAPAIGVEAAAAQVLDSLRAIADHFEGVAEPGLLKRALNEKHVVRIIFHQQNEFAV